MPAGVGGRGGSLQIVIGKNEEHMMAQRKRTRREEERKTKGREEEEQEPTESLSKRAPREAKEVHVRS